MAKLKIEKLGDNINEGTVANVLFKVGDNIKTGDVFLEMETDKALIDIISDKSGTVKKLSVKAGDKIKPGHVYAELAEDATQDADAPSSSAKVAKQSEQSKPLAASDSDQKKSLENINLKDQTINNLAKSSPLKEIELISKIPNLGDNIQQANLVKLLVKVGDVIKKGDLIAELESDKANFELQSQDQGEILEILIKENSAVKTGQAFFKLKQISTNDLTEPAKKDVSTAQFSANSMHLDHKKDSASNSVVAKASDFSSTTGDDLTSTPSQLYSQAASVNASPHVRRFAREIGVELSQVKGSGKSGRISIDDVKQYAKDLNQKISFQSVGAEKSVNMPDFSIYGELETVKLNAIKQVTAKHMANLWTKVPMVTQFDKADITKLEELRKLNKPFFINKQTNLTVTAILVKILVILLKEFPSFNASFDEENANLILKKFYNIAIAVDTENGLLVPVIKNVDTKSVLTIALELDSLSKKARSRKISPNDLSGASFTISNLGGISGTAFTPLVNWPEVAILGVAKSRIEPVYDGQSFKPSLQMPLCLSYDHRVIDGAEAARFLKRLIEILEQPFQIALIN